MNAPLSTPWQKGSPFATLRGFALKRPANRPVEHCELCSIALAPEHRHLLESATRRIICSCDACALRFENVLEGRFKLIPREIWSLPDLQIDDETWEAFSLPIGLAFFFHDSQRGKMAAFYPSPAGATESLLPLDSWNSLVANNSVLQGMRADVETFLANRIGERRDYYRVPIDACFELVGLIRVNWKGFTGGEAVWREIDGFFNRLAFRATPLRGEEVRHA